MQGLIKLKKKLSENILIERALKSIVWIFGFILWGLSIEFFEVDSEITVFSMGFFGLIISVVIWINQILYPRNVLRENKNLVIQCFVFFLIPTVGMVLALNYSININLAFLILYPISIFVTYKLSELLAKKDEVI